VNIIVPVSFQIIIEHPPINNSRGRTVGHRTETIQLFVEAPLSLSYAAFRSDYTDTDADTPRTITDALLAGLPPEVAEHFTPASERYIEGEVAKLLLSRPA